MEYLTQLYFVFSVVHNPYDEQVYLCVAMTKNVLLMQWYEPLEKFMKVKVLHVIIVFQFSMCAGRGLVEASVNIEHCFVDCAL